MGNVNGGAGERIATDLAEAGLKGPVKYCLQLCYEAFERNGETFLLEMIYGDTVYDNQMYFFDRTGNIQDDIRFDISGAREYTKDHIAENGKVWKRESRSYGINGSELNSRIDLYNDDGTTSEIFNYEKCELETHVVYEYDTVHKQLSKITTYDKEKKIKETETSKYDKRNFLTEIKREGPDGNLIEWRQFKLNSKGRTKEVTELDAAGNIVNRTSMPVPSQIAGKRKAGATEEDSEDEEQDRTERMYTDYFDWDHHRNWTCWKTYYKDQVLLKITTREIAYYGEEENHRWETPEQFLTAPMDIQNSPLGICTTIYSGYHHNGDVESKKFRKSDETVKAPTFLEVMDSGLLASLSARTDHSLALGYYVKLNGIYPSVIEFEEYVMHSAALLEYLVLIGAEMVWSWVENNEDNQGQHFRKYILGFAHKPYYLLEMWNFQHENGNDHDVPEHLEDRHFEDPTLLSCNMRMYYPENEYKTRDEEGLEADIFQCIEKARLYRKPTQPRINIVETKSSGEFELRSYPVKKNFSIKKLDLHYGQGFSWFHDELMDRFNDETQGLVLFHGLPGTGKTYYIRHLLKEMAGGEKQVIYMPPNLANHLSEPYFVTFLSKTISRFSAEGTFCVLLIEDAEPLLATRTPDARLQGVTNLLNMTDGLLNDILKLQVICTFNVELKELDSALLRPGRLLARKEFRPLSMIDANLLAIELGISHRFDGPATLSEIYALLPSGHTILHQEN